jgi:hypothetical protein
MEDFFPILLAIVFILGPLIEALKRKGKPPQQPPQRHVPPRAPQQRLPQPSRTEEVSAKPRTQESAATMVPDDLWEILTGQKQAPVLTTPPETRERNPHWDVVYEPEAEAEEVAEESAAREDVNVEVRRARVEAQSLETIGRHPLPVVISLEDNLPTAAQRHAVFHKKMVDSELVVVAAPQWKPLLVVGDLAELRRAFLLKEVLGTPKGLE